MKIFLVISFIFFAFEARAQMFFSTSEKESVVETKVDEPKDKEEQKTQGKSSEQTEEDSISPEEQKKLEYMKVMAEKKFAGKKSIHNQIKNQTKDERRQFLKVMKNADRNALRKKLLQQGKTPKEISEALEKIDSETVDYADGKEYQDYLFERAGLTDGQ